MNTNNDRYSSFTHNDMIIMLDLNTYSLCLN